jgi:hypothetical protein
MVAASRACYHTLPVAIFSTDGSQPKARALPHQAPCRASPDGQHVIADYSVRPDDGGPPFDGEPVRASVECAECEDCGDVELLPEAVVWDYAVCRASTDGRHVIDPDSVRCLDDVSMRQSLPVRASVACAECEASGDVALEPEAVDWGD